MDHLPEHPLRKVLVVSDSNIDQDSRVRNQLRWLTSAGWETDTLGQGLPPSDSNGQHFVLSQRPFLARLFAYVFLGNKLRFNFLMKSAIPQKLIQSTSSYDAIIVNEIDLLPWFVSSGKTLLSSSQGAKIHLDLHEYALSHGVGWLWNFLFSRYRRWLASFIPSDVFASRSVVASAIADLYVKAYGIQKPIVIQSCPEFVDLKPSAVDANNIRLIHHGKADLDRGLELLVDAIEYLDNRFNLTLMLIESGTALATLKKRAEIYSDRITFIDAVPVAEVARRLNEFDLEIIVFPPVTENLKYALPNKFFEAIQGRLGIISGQSPSMTELIASLDNGVVVTGWQAKDIADALNSLTETDIQNMKRQSDVAALVLNSEAEGAKFLAEAVPSTGASGSTHHASRA